MANREHVELVRSGAEAIAAWSRQHPQGRLDLSESDLSGLNLSKAVLTGANLSEANLSSCSLQGANLTRAVLTKARLDDADLSQSDLSRVVARGCSLHGARLTSARAVQANFSGAKMVFADLSDAALTGADLSGVNLSGGVLVQALLRGADLKGADLRRANFTEANLENARLNHAKLVEANFSWANLRRADFSKAICGGTIFAGPFLDLAHGLKTVRHRGASSLDFTSQVRSLGLLPEGFLRGCGLPERLIAAAGALARQAEESYACFLTYVRDDREFANQLLEALQARGVRCWLDEWIPEAKLTEDDDRRLRVWDKVILCASQSLLKHPLLAGEIEQALVREGRLLKEWGVNFTCALAVDVDGYLHSSECDHPRRELLLSRLVGEFDAAATNSAGFTGEVDRIVRALQRPDGTAATLQGSLDTTDPPQELETSAIPASDVADMLAAAMDLPGAGGLQSEPSSARSVMTSVVIEGPLQSLHRVMGKSTGLQSGFRRLLRNDGGNSIWYNYQGRKVPTHHLRQLSAGNVLEWETPPVMDDDQPFVNLVFAGSFGAAAEPETDGFGLLLNGREILRFDLVLETHAWISVDQKVALLFKLLWSSTEDAAGFFYVAVARDLVKRGEPVRLGAITRGEDSQRWFGINPVAEVVALQDGNATAGR